MSSSMKQREDCPAFQKVGKHEKVLSVDLDGTLFSSPVPQEIGLPIEGEVLRLRKLKAMGFYIIIHTARINNECEEVWGPQEHLIREALEKAGVPYDEIWAGRGKPIACHYIDDRSWKTVAAFFQEVEYRGELCGNR